MNIRKILKDDINQLSELYIKVSKEPPWNEYWKKEWAIERLSILFNCPGFYGYLCEAEGVFLGAIFSRKNSYLGNLELEVEELFVSPDHQGRGLGSQLMSKLSSSAKKDGISVLVLLTEKDSPAEKFYLNKEFKTKDEIVFMYQQI